MRIGLIVEYEGTAFHGSQLQANVRTVQGELEDAVKELLGGPHRVMLASRTDAGVHAIGQVAALDAETDLAAGDIRNALNYYLPEDTKIREVAPVDARVQPQATRPEPYIRVQDDRRRFTTSHRPPHFGSRAVTL